MDNAGNETALLSSFTVGLLLVIDSLIDHPILGLLLKAIAYPFLMLTSILGVPPQYNMLLTVLPILPYLEFLLGLALMLPLVGYLIESVREWYSYMDY